MFGLIINAIGLGPGSRHLVTPFPVWHSVWPAPVDLNWRKVLNLIQYWLLENSVQYLADV